MGDIAVFQGLGVPPDAERRRTTASRAIARRVDAPRLGRFKAVAEERMTPAQVSHL